jgi:hypothetical protein
MLSGNGPEDKGAAKERLPPSVTGRAKTPRTAFRGSILTLQKCMPSANEGCGMLTVYRLSEKGLEEATAGETAVPPDAAWVDLRQPTIDEDRAVEKSIGAALPSREETEEIEFSSRFCDIAAKARESLASRERLVQYAGLALPLINAKGSSRSRLKLAARRAPTAV